METRTVTIDNTTFTLHKMDAIEQLGVGSKLLPMFHKLTTIFKQNKEDENIEIMVDSVIEALQESNIEDLQFIMKSFLKKTYLNNICVMEKDKIIQPELVPLDVALKLMKEHFMLNFESYLKYLQ